MALLAIVLIVLMVILTILFYDYPEEIDGDKPAEYPGES